MIRYRMSRMTKEPRTSQKEAAWEIMEEAYLKASANDTLPALARQIYYQARPKIMELTDDKELQYGYFSQTLLPDYIEEKGVSLECCLRRAWSSRRAAHQSTYRRRND